MWKLNYKNRSPHVLPTASNLMGFCLIVQASIHTSGFSERTYMDEITAAATCLFMAACLFSYLSIRSDNPVRRGRYEFIADINFILGLFVLLVMVLMLSFKIIQ
ncbi:MAG: hypothetical protein JST06_10960 [Bacteroidetes bacterium]|nr:hypothetical protein [Bacteroidota bacterium]MBS1630339.1 hypothetical protein [Bacteroidota bacterium]